MRSNFSFFLTITLIFCGNQKQILLRHQNGVYSNRGWKQSNSGADSTTSSFLSIFYDRSQFFFLFLGPMPRKKTSAKKRKKIKQNRKKRQATSALVGIFWFRNVNLNQNYIKKNFRQHIFQMQIINLTSVWSVFMPENWNDKLFDAERSKTFPKIFFFAFSAWFAFYFFIG